MALERALFRKRLERGASTLTDVELIARVFGTGVRGANTLELVGTLQLEHVSWRNFRCRPLRKKP